ncbi:hypothetical protein H9P43_007731 [Blastocladiella emersonii ATCC 22665]|nr:hypothetical protein H9P43_007714 [Blastocladiella emersonii ATCC 22665]KAI9168359.1 hypothetical protein H9P43_007731 [Blastocladiella emersonii ATCC 22665]
MDGDAIAQTVLDRFDRIGYRPAHPPGSKRRDWTCVAGIVAEVAGQPLTCVAIGTGLKCLNRDSASCETVNDSHAEVLCRRAFRRFLLEQVDLLASGKPAKWCQILEPVSSEQADEPKRFRIRSDVRLHMYISQAPCGDGSLESLADHVREQGSVDAVSEANRTEHKRALIHAAAAEGGSAGLVRGRNGFDMVGVLRTKPGRNDAVPTCSHSCSDKLAQWQCVGLQGALLSILIPDPIVLASVVVGDLFNPTALERALVHRVADHIVQVPAIVSTRVAFAYSQQWLQSTESVPVVSAPHSVAWWLGSDKGAENTVNGRKQGAAPGKDGTFAAKTRSELSMPVWFARWLEVAAKARHDTSTWSRYSDAKLAAVQYQAAKAHLRRESPVFVHWGGNRASLDDFSITQ